MKRIAIAACLLLASTASAQQCANGQCAAPIGSNSLRVNVLVRSMASNSIGFPVLATFRERRIARLADAVARMQSRPVFVRVFVRGGCR